MFGKQEPIKRGPDGQWLEDDRKGTGANRRSIYLAQTRTRSVNFLHVFDCPDMTSDNQPERFRSSLPTQSLALMNNPLVMRTSKAFTQKVLEKSANNYDGAVKLAFEEAYKGKLATLADSAALVCAGTATGDYTALPDLLAFARQCDVLTFDHEHVPGEHLAALERAAEVSNKRYREALQQQQDQIVMSKQLAQIARDVPLKLNLKALEIQQPDKPALAALYRELGFSSLLKELGTEAVASSAPARDKDRTLPGQRGRARSWYLRASRGGLPRPRGSSAGSPARPGDRPI